MPYPGTTITLAALRMMKAASSAEPAFTGLSPERPPAAAPSSAPKPPRITLKNERFMPLHMM